MRLPLLLILPVLLLNALVDIYICRTVRQRAGRHAGRAYKFAVWSSILLNLFLTAVIAWPKKSGDNAELVNLMWCLYAYFSVYVPKYVFVLFDLAAKIPQLFKRKRIKAVSVAGIIAAVLVFAAIWQGALITPFGIDVKEVQFADQRVPADFDGLKIVQLSDIHTGTYGTDTTYLAKVVEQVNALQPDVVVFTGDIVNRRSEELAPFTGVLSRLKAPMGVYSVLGNHDYGDYYTWPSPGDKEDNRLLLRRMQADMGWKMLNNASAWLYRGNDSICIVGVENIGDPPFPAYGDLDAAYDGDLCDDNFKILLSHNPAHWVDDIKDAPDKNIALTLSGHTHAMQMEVCGMSPAAFRYKTWGGRYDDADSAHSLYVNIGLGEVGIPARIGATPEVTLITLRHLNR